MKALRSHPGRQQPIRSMLALAILAALGSQALAQEAPADGETTDTLQTILVEATAEKPQQSATANVTVVSAKQLDEEMARSFDDAVRYIPGVSVTDIGRFGSTGFNIRGLEGDRVAITVDGLSLGDTLDPASYQAYDFFRAMRGGVDIDALKTIEVIKGADSITAGSGALGGAVVLVTKDAADYLKASGNDTYLAVKGGYASDSNEASATATFANRTGIVESMLLYTKRRGNERMSHFEVPGTRGPERRVPDPMETDSDNLLAKLDLVLSDAHRVGVTAERAEATVDSEALSRLDATYLSRAGHDTSDRDRYGLHYIWTAGNALFDAMEARYDHQRQYTSGLTTMLFNSSTCPQGLRPCLRTEDRDYEQKLDRLTVHFDKAFDAGAVNHALVYGLAWQTRRAEFSAVDTRYVGQTGEPALIEVDPDLVPKTDIDSWNLYLRDRMSLLDGRLGLTAGLRYDRYDYKPSFDGQYEDPSGTVGDVSFSSPTGQLGIDFKLTDAHTLWAQVGRGFRAPTVEDMYSPTSTTPGVEAGTGAEVELWDAVANPDLEAEKSLNTEVGWRWQTDRQLLGISAYRDRYSNFIEQVTRVRNPDTAYEVCNASGSSCTVEYGDAYLTPENAGRVIVKGIEVEGRWLLGRDFSLRLAYSYNEGEKRNGDPLTSIVPASGVVGLRYLAPSRRWSVTGNLTHAAAKKRGDAVETDADGNLQPTSDFLSDRYTVFDLLANVAITDKLRLNAGVYNLFDEAYYRWQRVRFVTEGSGGVRGGVRGDGIDRYSEPGRNVRVSLTYRF